MLSNILQWHMRAPTTENHQATFGNCVEVDRPWSRLPQGPMLTSSFHSIPVGLGVWQLILFWGSLSKECSQFDIHFQAQQNPRAWSRALLLEYPQLFAQNWWWKDLAPELRSALIKQRGMIFGLSVPTAPLHPALGTELPTMLDCLFIGSFPSS